MSVHQEHIIVYHLGFVKTYQEVLFVFVLLGTIGPTAILVALELPTEILIQIVSHVTQEPLQMQQESFGVMDVLPAPLQTAQENIHVIYVDQGHSQINQVKWRVLHVKQGHTPLELQIQNVSIVGLENVPTLQDLIA